MMASVDAADGIKIPRTQAYSDSLAREIQQFREDDEFTNFTIHTSTRSFRCHQTILAGVSPVLKAMLRSSMTEASKQEVKLEHIAADVMEIILKYVYTGEAYVPVDKLTSIIEAADFLQLLELKELCLNKAVDVCKPATALSMFRMADKLDIDDLKAKCSDLISSSLAEISKFEEFLRLQSTELSSFLSSAQESDADPDDLLEATLDWIEYKPDERITSMENLVKGIDISECTVDCIEKEVQKHEVLLSQCPKVSLAFTKGMVEISKKGGARKKYKGKRGGTVKTIIVGGNDACLNKLCWELDKESFKELCNIPDHSLRFAVCQTPTGFALTGGEDCQLCSVFHMTTATWESLQPLKHPRYEHGAACVERKILVFGGRVSESPSASVQFLDMNGGEWTDGPNIPQAVEYPEVARDDSGIFLLDTWSSKQLFYLDMGTKKWTSRAPIPSPCRGARMVKEDGQLLVSGGGDGYNHSSRVFARYNISTDTWATRHPPSLDHKFGAMFYDNRRLYLLGGIDEDRVEEYSMDTESWSVCDIRVPKKLYNLHALVLH